MVETFLITSIKLLALAGFFCYDNDVFRAGWDSRPAVIFGWKNFFLNAKSSPRAQADVVRFHNRQYSLDGRRREAVKHSCRLIFI